MNCHDQPAYQYMKSLSLPTTKILTYPHLYLVPPLTVTPLELRHDLWRGQTRVLGLLYDVICVILRLAFCTIPACDRWTD